MSEIYSKASLGRSLCIITGASKGFGRALSHQVIDLLKPGSVLLLVARSGSLLLELQKELKSFGEEQQLTVQCITADLSSKDGVNEIVRVAKQQAENKLDHVLLIHNAASLGDISSFSSFTDPGKVNSYMSFNITSVLTLTAGLLQLFPPSPSLRWTVVNVSSIYAEEASPSWVLYCTAKAARKMMFKVLAEDEPNVKVLSYSPGPMETDMQEEIRKLTGISFHLFPCKESATKLMKLVLDNDFPSGTHLDFFDV